MCINHMQANVNAPKLADRLVFLGSPIARSYPFPFSLTGFNILATPLSIKDAGWGHAHQHQT